MHPPPFLSQLKGDLWYDGACVCVFGGGRTVRKMGFSITDRKHLNKLARKRKKKHAWKWRVNIVAHLQIHSEKGCVWTNFARWQFFPLPGSACSHETILYTGRCWFYCAKCQPSSHVLLQTVNWWQEMKKATNLTLIIRRGDNLQVIQVIQVIREASSSRRYLIFSDCDCDLTAL